MHTGPIARAMAGHSCRRCGGTGRVSTVQRTNFLGSRRSTGFDRPCPECQSQLDSEEQQSQAITRNVGETEALVSALERLATMYERGALTDEEYVVAKQKLLGM